MKKITLLTLAGAAILALGACNKVEEASAPKTLKLDLNIINAMDTKAVKTGWESGDKVYVFFGKPEDHTTPAYLTLTYNGSKWDAEWTAGLEAEIAATTSGTLTAVYTPSTISSIYFSDSFTRYRFSGTEGYYLCCNNVTYSVSAGVLSATLDMKASFNYVQFYLDGEASKADNLTFSCDIIMKTRLGSIAGDGSASSSNSDYGYPIKGVVYKGGLLFSGILNYDNNGVEGDYTLTITDNNGTPEDTSDDVTYTSTKNLTINNGDAFILPALTSSDWTVTP